MASPGLVLCSCETHWKLVDIAAVFAGSHFCLIQCLQSCEEDRLGGSLVEAEQAHCWRQVQDGRAAECRGTGPRGRRGRTPSSTGAARWSWCGTRARRPGRSRSASARGSEAAGRGTSGSRGRGSGYPPSEAAPAPPRAGRSQCWWLGRGWAPGAGAGTHRSAPSACRPRPRRPRRPPPPRTSGPTASTCRVSPPGCRTSGPRGPATPPSCPAPAGPQQSCLNITQLGDSSLYSVLHTGIYILDQAIVSTG